MWICFYVHECLCADVGTLVCVRPCWLTRFATGVVLSLKSLLTHADDIVRTKTTEVFFHVASE
jgi:hypothetical protein